MQRNSQEESKIFFMMADARFTEIDTKTDAGQDHGQPSRVNDDDIAEGDVQIVDINGYTMRHLAYISIFVLRVYMKFVQEAYPSRLRAVHIINCPSFLDRMMAMMKPFIREEVFQMVCTSHSASPGHLYNSRYAKFQIKYHTEGLDSLYEVVPRDMLPVEYGGKAGTIAEIKAHWMRVLKEKT